jgi:hypothetical protein
MYDATAEQQTSMDSSMWISKHTICNLSRHVTLADKGNLQLNAYFSVQNIHDSSGSEPLATN